MRKFYGFTSEISLKDVAFFFRHVRYRNYQKGDVILEQGSIEDAIFLVRKGLVRCFHEKSDNSQVTFDFVPEGKLFGNKEVIFYEEGSKFTYEAFEPCRVYSAPREELEELAERHPKYLANRKILVRRELIDATERNNRFILMTASERYRDYVKQNPELADRIPDKYLASMLGITPVTLSRIKSKMKNG